MSAPWPSSWRSPDFLRMRKLSLVLMFCLLLTGCFGSPRQTEPTQTLPEPGVVLYQNERYRLREELTTILILGLDKFEQEPDPYAYTNQLQSDFILLMVLDEAEGSYTSLHIDRDTMTDIQRLGVGGDETGTFVGQLALAHTYGSGGSDSAVNAMEAVSGLLHDMYIDHYITLTMDAVAMLNDLVGGVTVTVLGDFSQVDPSLVKGEQVTLQGDQALTYVRARYGVDDQTNQSRMVRQRQYLTALFDKVLEHQRDEDDFTANALAKLSGSFTTDCNVSWLSNLAQTLEGYTANPILSIEGESRQGEEFMEFYPDETALYETVLSLFYRKIS